jgi:hypothetical protein
MPWVRIPALAAIVFAAASGLAAAASDFTLDAAHLDKAAVRYRDPAQLSAFPVPALYFRAAGLSAGVAELAEIKERILYPLIERSPKPISAIVVQWFPAQPQGLGVTVLWSDGETREATVARTADGHYDPSAYAILFAKPTP